MCGIVYPSKLGQQIGDLCSTSSLVCPTVTVRRPFRMWELSVAAACDVHAASRTFLGEQKEATVRDKVLLFGFRIVRQWRCIAKTRGIFCIASTLAVQCEGGQTNVWNCRGPVAQDRVTHETESVPSVGELGKFGRAGLQPKSKSAVRECDRISIQKMAIRGLKASLMLELFASDGHELGDRIDSRVRSKNH